MRIEFALALNVFSESVINHQNLSEGDCEVGLTFALSFVVQIGEMSNFLNEFTSINS
jgi:hypothetical protein